MAGDTLGKGVDGLVQPLSQHISGCLEGSSSRGTWEEVAWQSSGPGYRPEHRNGVGGCGGDLGIPSQDLRTRRGAWTVQFIVRKQSLWLAEAEKDILRGARAAPSVGWASRGPRLNSRQKQGATRQDLSCGQAGEPPLEGAASAPDKSGHGHAALHAGHLVIAATKLP